MVSRRPRYLLDTNAVSEPLRPRPNTHLVDRWKTHRDEIAVSATVWHELVYGLEKLPPSRKKEAIRDYLADLQVSSMPILAYDEVAAEWHARERARLEGLGRSIPFRDSQIGAVARTHDLVLVTANVADFEALQDLEIENWLLS